MMPHPTRSEHRGLLWAAASCALGLFWPCERRHRSDSAPKGKAPTRARSGRHRASKPAAVGKAAPPRKAGPHPPEDVARANRILHSQQWQQTLHDSMNGCRSKRFMIRSSATIKTRLAAGINRMTPAQMGGSQ